MKKLYLVFIYLLYLFAVLIGELKIRNKMKREFIYILIIVVLASLFFRECSKVNSLKSESEQNTKALNDSLKYTKNKLGQEVASKLLFQGDKNTLQKIIDSKESENSQLKIALRDWKKIASAVKVETETKIDTVYIPFKDSIPYEFTRTFEKVDTWYSIFGTVTHKGISIDNIFIPNTQTIISGKKKVSFLKTEYRFEVTNSNPYIKTKTADIYNFTEPNKRFGISTIVGYGFSNKGLTPFVGVGLTYTFIKL